VGNKGRKEKSEQKEELEKYRTLINLLFFFYYLSLGGPSLAILMG
jgi:hypothetical protein